MVHAVVGVLQVATSGLTVAADGVRKVVRQPAPSRPAAMPTATVRSMRLQVVGRKTRPCVRVVSHGRLRRMPEDAEN